jgi:hypothetical protein
VMLHSPPKTRAAVLADKRRKRQARGVRWELRAVPNTKRFAAAVRASAEATGADAGPLDSRESLEAALAFVVDGFMRKWLGPPR